jgi:hypothetical protein
MHDKIVPWCNDLGLQLIEGIWLGISAYGGGILSVYFSPDYFFRNVNKIAAWIPDNKKNGVVTKIYVYVILKFKVKSLVNRKLMCDHDESRTHGTTHHAFILNEFCSSRYFFVIAVPFILPTPLFRRESRRKRFFNSNFISSLFRFFVVP